MADHAKAQAWLFLCYGNEFNKWAWNLILNQTQSGFQALRKQNPIILQQKKAGFFSSQTQSELAKRPRKKRKPYTRCIYVQNALKHGFILENLETHKIRAIKGNPFVDFRSLFHFWLAQPE